MTLSQLRPRVFETEEWGAVLKPGVDKVKGASQQARIGVRDIFDETLAQK